MVNTYLMALLEQLGNNMSTSFSTPAGKDDAFTTVRHDGV